MMVRAGVLDEPLLEFGNNGREIDIRLGLMRHGPLEPERASRVRLGIIGTADTIEDLSRETLSLTKMNWNSTQFDGSLPITLRAARVVGRVLKHVSAGALDAPEYRFYI